MQGVRIHKTFSRILQRFCTRMICRNQKGGWVVLVVQSFVFLVLIRHRIELFWKLWRCRIFLLRFIWGEHEWLIIWFIYVIQYHINILIAIIYFCRFVIYGRVQIIYVYNKSFAIICYFVVAHYVGLLIRPVPVLTGPVDRLTGFKFS